MSDLVSYHIAVLTKIKLKQSRMKRTTHVRDLKNHDALVFNVDIKKLEMYLSPGTFMFKQTG